MSNKSKKPLMPKLRFPEFRGNGDWDKCSLANVMIEHGYKSTGSEEVFSVSVHKGLVNQIEHLGRSFSAFSTNHYNRVLPGDVVYTKSPTGNFPLGIIKQSKLDFPVIVSPLYGVFSPETAALGTMLDAYFETPENVKAFLESLVQKGAKNTINIKNSRFLSGTLVLPKNKKEQQKIADCLNSLDELITAQTKKLEALKTHKKGLMQKLFPAEGKNVPEWRFPEFRGKGEWEEKTIGECAIDSLDYGMNAAAIDYDGKNKYIRITDIDESTSKYISDNPVSPEGELLDKYIVGKNSILFARTGASTGKTYLYKQEDGKLYFAGFLIRAKIKNEYNPIFIFAQTQTLHYYKWVKLISMRSGQPGINSQEYASYKFFIPSKQEQQKIANCLSSLNELITAQTQKLESLKTHKKGLIQGLFPSVEEVDI